MFIYCLWLWGFLFVLVKSICPFKIDFEYIVSVLYFSHYILKQIVIRPFTVKGETLSQKECLSYRPSFQISD